MLQDSLDYDTKWKDENCVKEVVMLIARIDA